MAGFLKFLAAILPTLINWIKGWGAAEERARQKREADALQEHLDEIGGDGRDLDTALSRLRRKQDASRRVP